CRSRESGNPEQLSFKGRESVCSFKPLNPLKSPLLQGGTLFFVERLVTPCSYFPVCCASQPLQDASLYQNWALGRHRETDTLRSNPRIASRFLQSDEYDSPAGWIEHMPVRLTQSHPCQPQPSARPQRLHLRRPLPYRSPYQRCQPEFAARERSV